MVLWGMTVCTLRQHWNQVSKWINSTRHHIPGIGCWFFLPPFPGYLAALITATVCITTSSLLGTNLAPQKIYYCIWRKQTKKILRRSLCSTMYAETQNFTVTGILWTSWCYTQNRPGGIQDADRGSDMPEWQITPFFHSTESNAIAKINCLGVKNSISIYRDSFQPQATQ